MDDHAELVVRIRSLLPTRPSEAYRKASHLKRVLGQMPLRDDVVFNAQRFALIGQCRSIVTEAKLALVRAGAAVPHDDDAAGDVVIFPRKPQDRPS
jgi:hypothetical protein